MSIVAFRQYNEFAKKNGVVLFGSTEFFKIPLNEFAQDFETDVPVYNRSIEGLRIEEVADVLDSCVFDLNPSKVFISFGEEDVECADFDSKRFIDKYQWILYNIHNRCRARIYIVSVLSLHPAAALVNDSLMKLAGETGCEFVNAAPAMKSGRPSLNIFGAIRPFMRNRPISFCEAMLAR